MNSQDVYHIKIIRRSNQFYFNDRKVFKIVKSKQQALNYIFVVDGIYERHEFLQRNADAQAKMVALNRIQDISHVPKIIKGIDNVKFELYLSDLEREVIGLSEAHIYNLIIYEYVSYSPLQKSTFSPRPEGILNKTELRRFMQLFKEICITINQIYDRDIFLVDLSPESILGTDTDFQLTGFQYAKLIPERAIGASSSFGHMLKIVDVHDPLNPLSNFEGPGNLRFCHRSSIQGLGRFMYYILTGSKLQKPIEPAEATVDPLLYGYGPEILDLICSLTSPVPVFRYSTTMILRYPNPFYVSISHPAFDESNSMKTYWEYARRIFRAGVVRNMKQKMRRNSIGVVPRRKPQPYAWADDLSLISVTHCLKELQPCALIREHNFRSFRQPIFVSHHDFNRRILAFNYLIGIEDRMEEMHNRFEMVQSISASKLEGIRDAVMDFHVIRPLSRQPSYSTGLEHGLEELHRVSVDEDILETQEHSFELSD